MQSWKLWNVHCYLWLFTTENWTVCWEILTVSRVCLIAKCHGFVYRTLRCQLNALFRFIPSKMLTINWSRRPMESDWLPISLNRVFLVNCTDVINQLTCTMYNHWCLIYWVRPGFPSQPFVIIWDLCDCGCNARVVSWEILMETGISFSFEDHLSFMISAEDNLLLKLLQIPTT